MGSRHGTAGRHSYPLTWRSGPPRASPSAGHKTDISHTSDIDRDSQEGIVKDDIIPDSRTQPLSRRGSGIFVTNEFSVISDDVEKRKPQSQSEGQDGDIHATNSVNEDKPDGKSPFYHV